MFDVVIRGGEVVDGTGGARRRADVAISGGRIVELGANLGRGRRTIDAGGRVVAPGFVDVHTHYDVQGFWDPLLSPSALQGVTTVLAGNCGFSIAPLDSDSAEYMMRTLARVEGMPLATLAAGAPWDWTTTEDYLDRLDGTLGLNAGFMVGHTAVRRLVMGEEATRREATGDELQSMVALVRSGIEAGAIGFSTSRGSAHRDANGDAVPSRHATIAEMVTLAKVCGEYGGTSLEFIPSTKPFTDDDRDAAVGMTVAARRPLNWNLISATAAALPADLAALEVSDLAASRGGKIVGLVMPMEISARFSFATAFALDSIPGWEKDMAKPIPERLALLRDPDERRRLGALAARIPSDRAYMTDWQNRVIAETVDPSLGHYEGRLVQDIAAEEGKEPFDALLDIVCADELRTTFMRLPSDAPGDWQARERIWQDSRIVIGGSDAGAHSDLLATFSYTVAFLATAVRERGVLTLEDAVAQLTSRPADLYGLVDRGRLVDGAHADVVVFDPDTVAPGRAVVRRDLPGGAGRFYAEADGIDQVLVNGETVVAEGAYTDARPGKLLRSGRDTRTPSLV